MTTLSGSFAIDTGAQQGVQALAEIGGRDRPSHVNEAVSRAAGFSGLLVQGLFVTTRVLTAALALLRKKAIAQLDASSKLQGEALVGPALPADWRVTEVRASQAEWAVVSLAVTNFAEVGDEDGTERSSSSRGPR